MAKPTILINLTRCTGCWACSMACKIGNDLPDDVWRHTVRTLGGGDAIDRPAGKWGELRMSWLPIHHKSCTMCADLTSDGASPYCVNACPNEAMWYGDLDNPQSEISLKIEELRQRGYRISTLPSWENSRSDIVYAKR